MVFLITHLKRRAGMEPDEFQRHWRQHHGPLVRDKLGSYIVGYEQYPPLPGQPWDGVAIMTFNRREDFDAFLADPNYAEHVFPDEQAFLDHDGLAWQLVDEPVAIIP